MIDSDLEYLLRAADLSDRLRRLGADVEADRLLGEAIDGLGVELAKRDPVTAAMLDLDVELGRLALVRLAAARAGVPVFAPLEETDDAA